MKESTHWSRVCYSEGRSSKRQECASQDLETPLPSELGDTRVSSHFLCSSRRWRGLDPLYHQERKGGIEEERGRERGRREKDKVRKIKAWVRCHSGFWCLLTAWWPVLDPWNPCRERKELTFSKLSFGLHIYICGMCTHKCTHIHVCMYSCIQHTCLNKWKKGLEPDKD